MGTKQEVTVVIWNPPYSIDTITPGEVDEVSAQMAQVVGRELNIDWKKISIETNHWPQEEKEITPGSKTPLVMCTCNVDGEDNSLLSQKVREIIFRLIGEKTDPKYDPNSVVSLLARGVGGLSDLEEYRRLQAAGRI